MSVAEDTLAKLAVDRLLEARTRVPAPCPIDCPHCARRASNRDKRRERRIATDEQARMHPLAPTPARLIDCRILDTSRSGMKIRAAIELEPGTLVQVFTSTLLIMAEVRHCRPYKEVFVMGLAVDNTLRIPNSSRTAH